MLILKVTPVFLLILVAGAEKKIELQDIEEDNLKSEKEKELEKPEQRSQSGPGAASVLPLDFFKTGLLRYFENPAQAPQQPRYVQQYAVTEPPEAPVAVTPKPHYASPATQQAMVGYLSNVPMQIYLVPQYYNGEQAEQSSAQSGVQYAQPGVSRVASYQTAPEAVQTQGNFIEVPAYVTPSGKAYIPQYTSPVAYVNYAPQPTLAPAQATVTPVLAYQMPIVQYPTAVAAPPVAPKNYYQNIQYTDTNNVGDEHESENESPKQYVPPTEVPYSKPETSEYPRYYNSRAPIREEYRHSAVSELPPPSPLLLKSPPPHLAHIPKALPSYRPLIKPVFAAGGHLIPNAYTPRPNEVYGPPFKRRPASLLESYIPSSVQFEYLKRGYAKDPVSIYDVLSGRHFSHAPVPRQYERGFLPNQMYHTAAGGITYGHYKRAPKVEKVPHK